MGGLFISSILPAGAHCIPLGSDLSPPFCFGPLWHHDSGWPCCVIVVFRSRRGDRLKILVFDGTGLVLVYNTRLAEQLLLTYKQTLTILQARQDRLRREREKQGGPAVPPH